MPVLTQRLTSTLATHQWMGPALVKEYRQNQKKKKG
jgi:hypothetical protein